MHAGSEYWTTPPIHARVRSEKRHLAGKELTLIAAPVSYSIAYLCPPLFCSRRRLLYDEIVEA